MRKDFPITVRLASPRRCWHTLNLNRVIPSFATTKNASASFMSPFNSRKPSGMFLPSPSELVLKDPQQLRVSFSMGANRRWKGRQASGRAQAHPSSTS